MTGSIGFHDIPSEKLINSGKKSREVAKQCKCLRNALQQKFASCCKSQERCRNVPCKFCRSYRNMLKNNWFLLRSASIAPRCGSHEIAHNTYRDPSGSDIELWSRASLRPHPPVASLSVASLRPPPPGALLRQPCSRVCNIR